MWKLATLILIFLSGALGSRQGDTLASCNYINDANPDDGTYIGWYAINKASPTDYCNFYQVYSNNSDSATIVNTGTPFFGQVVWYYTCNGANVDKYFCINDTTCQTGCQFGKTYTPADADFNCADPTGECLFKWTTYVNIDPAGCDAGDKSRVTRQTYAVNGGCQNQTSPGSAASYALQVCSDPEVYNSSNGVSSGYTNEMFSQANCSKGGSGYPNQVGEGDCGFPIAEIEGVLEVNDCTGTPDAGWAWVTDGVIDYLGTCDACTSELDVCVQTSTCELTADYLFAHFPDCSADFESLETDFINPVWCENGIDCDTNGFTAMYNCVKNEECFVQKNSNTPLHCTSITGWFAGITDNWLSNDIIDGMSDCVACTSEIDTCLADSTKNCEAFGDILFRDFPDCSSTFESFEDYVDRFWCNATWQFGADCSANGFDAMYQCIQQEECNVQMVASTEEDRNCSCDIEPCLGDATCTYAVSSPDKITFDDNPNVFSDIYELCNNFVLPDGNVTDCAVFKDFMMCNAGCDKEESDPDDCFSTDINSTLMFDCIFVPDCFEPYNATLASIFNGVCEETLCSPTDLSAVKTEYCDTQANDCSNSMYITLYDSFLACAEQECVWENCLDEIDVCKSTPTCKEELQWIIDIEDNYDVGNDDDFAGMVKDWYCRERGGCDPQIAIAYECVKTNDCLDLRDDKCWEINCGTEVTACNDKEACIDTLITIIGNETQCAADIASKGGDYIYCPEDCDDLYIANYSSCGTAMWDGSALVGDPATTLAVYEECKAACKDCDNFLPIALNKCGDGECGETFNGLMQCVLRECPDKDEEDDICFSQTCTAKFVDCLFTQECHVDWSWVEAYFQRLDNLWQEKPIDYTTLFEYGSTWDIDGCSLKNLTETCADEVACEAAAFQCYYYDIREYCNQNGCSIKFWNMLNCFFECHFDFSIDTIVPTQAPVPTSSPAEVTQQPAESPVEPGTAAAANYFVRHIGFMVVILCYIKICQ